MGRGKRKQGLAAASTGPRPFEQLVYSLQDRLVAASGDSYLELVPSSEVGVVYLELLVVRPVDRGRGHGSRILAEICAEADRRGWTLRLAPIASSLEIRDRLARLYARFGFAYDGVGRELMERPPGRKETDPLLARAAAPDLVEEWHFDHYVGG